MTLAPGSKLGHYEILAPIGAGSMGQVYKAKDTRLDRDVAVKVLSPDLANNPDALARFEREAKAVAILNHPNILGIYNFGREGETTYAVMELLEGESLRMRLNQGPLPLRTALDLGKQMAIALAAAHDKGLIHRDLKPGNIWITKEGRLKILDFGLVKLVNPSISAFQSISVNQVDAPSQESQTKKGMILGTLGYMSPEQVRGVMVDARSDIFSFGAVLFEMLTGKQAFARDNASDTLAAILRDDFVDVAETRNLIPPELLSILHHCIEKNPEQRFQSAHDVAFALENSSASSPNFAPFIAPFVPKNWRVSRKWATLVAGLLICVGFLGWALRGMHVPKPTFKQITFRLGNVLRARFTPDGQNVVYSAAWDGKPAEIFMSRLDGSAVRAIGLRSADLMAVNGRGELLILLKASQWAASTNDSGMLALSSLDGGTPREIKGRVRGADFAPDGQAMAVIYQDQEGGNYQLDYPLGTRILADIKGFIGAPRISPQGDRVAFVYLGTRGRLGAKGGIAVVDRAGKRRDLNVDRQVWDQFLTWSKDGREIFFATKAGLKAVDMNDHVRMVNPDSTPPFIHDISAQGLMLLERQIGTNSSIARFQGQDLDLGWQNQSRLTGFSRDGSLALLYESGGGEFCLNRPFLRRFDQSPPKILDSGIPLDLTPNGDYALILIPEDKPRLLMVPTGLGVPRELSLEGWDAAVNGHFSSDGKYVYVFGVQRAGPARILRLPVDGSRGSVLPESILNVKAFSPDENHLLCVDTTGQPSIASAESGTSRPLPWQLGSGESVVAWTWPTEALLAHPEDATHLRVDRVDIATGRRTVWQRLVPPDPATTIRVYNVRVSRDGRTVGYTYTRILVSDLIVAEGLK
ncbi:MAG: serine/threonine-protein kinase [Holophagaceae bacterium]|nr:serine/threonine-protein kinase [Holophagaceae bacterium]